MEESILELKNTISLFENLEYYLGDVLDTVSIFRERLENGKNYCLENEEWHDVYLMEVRRFDSITIQLASGKLITLPFFGKKTAIFIITDGRGEPIYENEEIKSLASTEFEDPTAIKRNIELEEEMIFGDIITDTKKSSATILSDNFTSRIGRIYYLEYLDNLFPDLNIFPSNTFPFIPDDPKAYRLVMHNNYKK